MPKYRYSTKTYSTLQEAKEAFKELNVPEDNVKSAIELMESGGTVKLTMAGERELFRDISLPDDGLADTSFGKLIVKKRIESFHHLGK